jgi:hypothetical protein
MKAHEDVFYSVSSLLESLYTVECPVIVRTNFASHSLKKMGHYGAGSNRWKYCERTVYFGAEEKANPPSCEKRHLTSSEEGDHGARYAAT